MRRLFLGLLLIGLFGAALGAVLTWPKRASEVARASPTLYEFQTGVRVQQHSGTPNQRSLALAARAEAKAIDESPAAVQLARVMDRARNELDRTPDTSGQAAEAALLGSSRAPPQLLSAGENLPEMALPQPAEPNATPGPPQRRESSMETAAPRGTALPPSDLPTVTALASEMEQPRTQTQNDDATDAPEQTLVTGGQVTRISVHYHKDPRSRTDAQQILRQLRAAGLTKVEMHTTARGITSSSLVRYFSQQDAPAAVSLANMLGSKTATWRADDCTAYRRKPEPGTLELWPVAVVASPPAKAKSQPAKLNAAR